MSKINRIQIYSILIFALLLHLSLLNYIKILGAVPDLLLTSVIFFGLFSGWRTGLESGLIAGLLKDIFTLDVFWINTIIFGVAGFSVGALNTKFFKESKMTQVLLVLVFTVFSMVIHFLSVSFLTKSIRMGLFEYLFTSVVPTSIYTALVSIPIFSKFIDIFGLREEDEGLL